MNDNAFIKIKAAIVAAAGAFTAAFGWLGWLVIAWVACMALDWITGSLAAAKTGSWQSSRAREGIYHKAGMIFAVLVSAGADGVLFLIVNNIPGIVLPFAYTTLICPIVMCWYIFTELGSIAENAYSMGAPVPKFLIKMLAAAKNAAEAAGDKLAAEDKSTNDNTHLD